MTVRKKVSILIEADPTVSDGEIEELASDLVIEVETMLEDYCNHWVRAGIELVVREEVDSGYPTA